MPDAQAVLELAVRHHRLMMRAPVGVHTVPSPPVEDVVALWTLPRAGARDVSPAAKACRFLVGHHSNVR